MTDNGTTTTQEFVTAHKIETATQERINKFVSSAFDSDHAGFEGATFKQRYAALVSELHGIILELRRGAVKTSIATGTDITHIDSHLVPVLDELYEAVEAHMVKIAEAPDPAKQVVEV